MKTLTIREALELSAELWLHVATSRTRPYEYNIKENAIEARQQKALEKFGLKYVVGNCWLCQCTSCSSCPLLIDENPCMSAGHPYREWDILRDKLYCAHQRNDKEAIVELAVKADAEAAKVLAIINKALEALDAK